MKFIGAGLGENLDSTETQFVVFRREGILVDADLANRILRRQLATAESVNVD